jgi:hypothetical protein
VYKENDFAKQNKASKWSFFSLNNTGDTLLMIELVEKLERSFLFTNCWGQTIDELVEKLEQSFSLQ